MSTGEVIFLCLIIAEIILAVVGFIFYVFGFKRESAQLILVGLAFILISLVCSVVGAILGKVIP